ncbi:fimbria/pilus outer membrane usher protein [Ramlibacter alkalitolerans]|uniref:Fimbrial biogenesis outer membrane usher protein n=1 Tax=Ramlibacter alkalitolerans TaxID=2039631 RepID=A0ABS1JML2_9BURK|nr:fimbria/pilus outer membrane usher protein [Ramlibacter alkalitolerans]MBL0425480.1 fimbrial biogenesis outer membrane usher protein [Ramlibacter alkalitolerans]
MSFARVCTAMALAVIQTLATGAGAQATRAETPAGTAPVQDRIVPLEATVNGDRVGTWPFVERQGALFAGADAIEEWRLRRPADSVPIRVRGKDFHPLSAFAGYSARVNYATLTVELSFSPDAFTGTRLVLERELQRPQASPVLPTVFLNYDLNLQRSASRGGPGVTDLGALLELGVSGPWGVFTTSEVGRNLSGGLPGQPTQAVRLESTFTHHLPARNLSLRLGDSSTRPGLWGRSVYFGGVQFGTNYALTPGFITQPLPLLSGVSAAPSTVELYVNDVLRKVSQVPAGPFVVDNTLGLTGSGEARLVVRDVLGREVVVVQPFFTSVQLLAPGLDDWSVETGLVRENLGLASADYGQRFAAGTWRRGLTQWLTLEGRTEWTRGQRTLGAGAIAAAPGDLLVRGAVARSMNDRIGDGGFWLLALERQWLQAALTVQASGASRDYRELGVSDLQLPTRAQLAANLTRQFGNVSLGAGFARIERYDQPGVTTLGFNFGYRFENSPATLNGNLSKVLGQGGGTSLGVTLQVPLDRQRFTSLAVSSHGGVQDVYATAARFPSEPGELGWRVLGGRLNEEAHAEAGLDYAGSHGRVYSDVSASPSQQSLRLGASGGMALAAGRAFFSRRIEESFAVVSLKGYPGVGVGLGSTVMTQTDSDGIAFLPYLSSYQANQVRLNAQDLPISAELDSIEHVVVPSWRSAVLVDFPVRSGRAALVRMQQDDGEPVPAGAQVRIEGQKEEVYVGRRGEAFVTGLQPANRLDVHWSGGRCSLALALPPAANDDVLRIGPLPCRSVR